MQLLKWKVRRVLAPGGWALLLAIFAALAASCFAFAHAFLSVNRPVAANILVMEGWLPDYALADAVGILENDGYDYLVAAGGPLPQGYLISGYDTYAAIAAATLLRLGAPPERLIEVPGMPTLRNRTLESARAVREKLRNLGIPLRGINLVSEGAHARRTRLVYRRVFGSDTDVGVISIRSQGYDPGAWWQSSEGVKSTVSEGFGWLFECVFWYLRR